MTTQKISDDARAIGQKIYADMESRLLVHRMSTLHEADDEQSGYPLIDFMSHDKDLATGKNEIEMMVDDVACGEIDAIVQQAIAAARDKALEDAMQAVHMHHPNEKAVLEAIRAMKVKP